MLISFLTWWYGKGLAWSAEKILEGIERSIDTFSLGLLIKTWFAPFRQIDALGVLNASIEVRIKKFFDKLFSRSNNVDFMVDLTSFANYSCCNFYD